MAVTVKGALTDVSAFDRSTPGTRYVTVQTQAKAAGSEATKDLAYWIVPHDCRLTCGYFTPYADVSGADTNSTNLNIVNRGLDGAGTTEISSLELTSGNDLTAAAKNQLATGLTTDLSAGQVIALEGELVGTGLAVGEGYVTFGYDGG